MNNNSVISINIRTDEETKNEFSNLCKVLGLSVSSALNMIMKSSVRNKEIPIKLSAVNQQISLDSLTKEQLQSLIEQKQL